MVETMKTKPLWLVLIVTAHMVFNVLSRGEVTGILGDSITLQFTFNNSLAQSSHFVIHRYMETGRQKIAEFKQGKGDIFDVNPQSNSVFWHIPKLRLNDSGYYRASLMAAPVEKSESVKLTVRELNTSSTVSPIPSDIPTTAAPGVGGSYMMILLLISPVVVLIAALPFLIWALVGREDKPQPRQNSKPRETVPESVKVPERSLVYSVLDFPKRSSAVVEVNPSDTEYAAVSYLPEMRQV